ncbi:MAG: hypothetical protein M4D80_15960 [Myxococcota bacterium]|nr:hypothetical protein [Myxococcota bacterium]
MKLVEQTDTADTAYGDPIDALIALAVDHETRATLQGLQWHAWCCEKDKW